MVGNLNWLLASILTSHPDLTLYSEFNINVKKINKEFELKLFK